MLVLVSRANVDEVDRLRRSLERTNFAALAGEWCLQGEGRSLDSGNRDHGVNYLFYNSHNERMISPDEAYNLIRMAQNRLPSGHPVG